MFNVIEPMIINRFMHVLQSCQSTYIFSVHNFDPNLDVNLAGKCSQHLQNGEGELEEETVKTIFLSVLEHGVT